MNILNKLKTKLTIITLACALLTALPVFANEICQTAESDPDGDGWGWEKEASCRVTEATGRIPVLYHPRDGQRIFIERIFWTWNDFSKKTFNNCEGFIVDPSKDSDECSTCEGEGSTYQHLPNGKGLLRLESRGQGHLARFNWNVDSNGLYVGALPLEAYGERVEGGVRFWVEAQPGRIGFYTFCEVTPSSMGPLSSASSDEPACVDSDNDGYGWNGFQSCIP